jgi:hypothetical protein
MGSCFVAPAPPACPHGTPDGGGGTNGGGGAGGADCSSLLPMPSACGMCTLTTCCAELQACNAITNCIDCVTGATMDAITCGAQPIVDAIRAINACGEGCCAADCYTPPCNPVTGAPCNTAAGETCDLDSTSGTFACFQAPNVTGICEQCDNMGGPYCAAGLHCLHDTSGNSDCAHFCCTDADCSSTGKCDLSELMSGAGGGDGGASVPVGVCVPK